MNSLYLPCWRKVVRTSATSVEDRFEDPYQGWPPIKLYPAGHLDIEFGPFLLADSAIMDTPSFERLTERPPQGLGRAASSLKTLQGEGYIRLVDYESILSKRRDQIVTLTNKELEGPHYYQSPLRQAFTAWDSISHKYASSIGRGSDLVATVPLGILNALAAEGNTIGDSGITRLRRLADKEKRFTKAESQVLSEMVRPYLEHVHTNLALSKDLNAPIFDWADTGPMYKAVMFSHFDSNKTMEQDIPKVRELFSVSLTAFEPSSAEECLRALNNRHIKEFRRFINDAAENTIAFDPDLSQKLLSRAFSGRSSSRVGTTVNIVSAAASIAISIFGGLASAVAMAVGGAIGAEVVGRKLYDIDHRDIGWLLFLADAKTGA